MTRGGGHGEEIGKVVQDLFGLDVDIADKVFVDGGVLLLLPLLRRRRRRPRRRSRTLARRDAATLRMKRKDPVKKMGWMNQERTRKKSFNLAS